MGLVRRRIAAASCFVGLMSAALANAHRSVASQHDPSASLTVEGIVVEVLMRNPHSRIRTAITNDAGVTEEWMLEMDDVADMAEQGVTSETLHAGDELVVFGFPARDGSRLLHIESFQRPSDGLEYEDD